MTEQAQVGDLLRAAREEAGLSLREMGEKIHFGKSYLGDIELGKLPAPLKVIEAYAQVKEDIAMKRRTMLAALAATPLGMPNDPTSAETALRYGLWLGDQGKITEANIWYSVATSLADRTGDQPTQAYVRARTASRGLYEGWPVSRVAETVGEAMKLHRHGRAMVEAQAALVHVHTKAGNLPAARDAGRTMLNAAETEDDHARAAAFNNYLECMIGDPREAVKAWQSYEASLRRDPTLLCDSRVYLGMAHIRAGDRRGASIALEAAKQMNQHVRIVGIGISDLLRQVNWRSPEVDQLRAYATV